MLRQPPIHLSTTCVALTPSLAKLIRLTDGRGHGQDLLVLPREAVTDHALLARGYSNPHHAMYDAYAELFDAQFEDELRKGIVNL